MNIVRPEQYEEAYRVGLEHFDGKFGLTEARRRLESTGLAPNTASILAGNVTYFLKGQCYKRALSAAVTNDYLTWILRDRKQPGLEKALEALRKHIDYFEDKYRSRCLTLRKVLEKHYALLISSLAEPVEEYELDEAFSAEEGRQRVRLHRYRERSRELVLMAKQVFREQNDGRLFCEVCGFDFGKTYGAPDFIEVHHKLPLCNLEPGTKTKLSDLAMVCANCHRMLHRGNPWPTVDGLKLRLEVKKMK